MLAITLKPWMWNGGAELSKHHAKGVMFVLDGARETRIHGSSIFPETLRSELHGVRAVIEAYSKAADIAGKDEPHAAGLMVDDRGRWNVRLRVANAAGTQMEYVLDRWD